MTTESHSLMKEIDQVDSMVKWLASFGQSDSGGVNRLLYSPSWVQAQHALENKMKSYGFITHFDSVGNLFGKLQGSTPNTKTILTGSHIDSVLNGGIYDGVYGIIASLLAVKKLHETYGTPKKSIEVVSLCEEEGSRFPLTFWGSGNITGKYTLEDIEGIKDTDGVLFSEAMKNAGFDPVQYSSPQRNDIDCFIELHVEQGIVLEKKGSSIGTVSHIVGQRRYTVTITGESNHAGTTPMPYRKDALATAGHFISYISEKAIQTDPQLVATVGKINASPNVPNVIAGEAQFTLDVRHFKEDVLDEFCDHLANYFKQVAQKREMEITIDQWMNVQAVKMDPSLTELSKLAATEKNITFEPLISGAGHDAQVFGTFCPTSLLFVPSEKGISHSPKESTKKEDLEKGIELLTELLYRLAY
ncbi:allantoate deiminase [Aquibacillus albus]|uniref:Allantoate deiminase n=1 Tax=Aquibacillus albus TaxID=1168171 RepID=A0ABS2MZ13_9BACI|nr:allantoate deiminase [Aquibacillus albus]